MDVLGSTLAATSLGGRFWEDIQNGDEEVNVNSYLTDFFLGRWINRFGRKVGRCLILMHRVLCRDRSEGGKIPEFSDFFL